MKRKIAQGNANARIAEYRETIAWLWGFAIFAVAIWSTRDRAFGDLGLELSLSWGFWIGLAVTAAVIVFFAGQIQYIRRDAEARKKVREQLGQTTPMIPHTLAELRVFFFLSITAGICEEIVYRGFLIWYFGEHLAAAGITGATATALAWLLSTLVFGFAHIYLGTAGALRAGIMGGLFGGGYLLTGSLWVPMILHAAVDIASGWTGYLACQDVPAEDGGLEAPNPADAT
ncbi:MAG: CPBP family intramembrane glutamic endopeptidase [Acidobacteriota bacterium]